MIVWLISSNDTLSLPVAVFNTLKECSEWLGIPLETAKTAFKRHGFYRGRQYCIERIIL